MAFKATPYQIKNGEKNNSSKSGFKATKYKTYDSNVVSGWEQTNRQSLDIISNYNNRINKSEWLTKEDRAAYKKALDSYIETSNYLRGINKTFGEGYTDEDEKSWLDSVTSMNKGYDEISGFYDQFESDKVYGDWLKQSQDDESYNTYFSNIDGGKASQGWQKYLSDGEETKNAPKHDLNGDGEEKWWEKLLGYLGDGGGVVDTTMPTAGVTQTVNALREDESYRRPNDSWTEEQKNAFGQLYLESPELAYIFAEKTNKRNSKAKEEEAVKRIQEAATSSFGAGLGHTIGAIATAPLGLADYLGDLAYANAGRDVAPDGMVSPFEYSQAVTGGISTHLNEKGGTLDENIPVLGGKGWGDVYGLGTSIAQSMTSAYTLGPAGTLVSYFGQGAASGVDEALARGASEGQAFVYGAALGAFEGIAEQIGIDNLFKLGSASTIKGLLKNIVKQAGAEGAEEGLTAILSNIADAFIMQDKSNFAYQLAAYKNEGLSDSDAKWRVFRDSLEGIAFDTIAGAASGAVSGGIHTTAQTIGNNINAKKVYGDNAQDLVTEALDIDPNNALAQKMQAKLDKGKNLSGGQLNRLVEANDSTLVSQDKGKMKAAAEARLTELGERSDISKLADIIVKAEVGEKLTRAETQALEKSDFGRSVSRELSTEALNSNQDMNRWAESIDTERVNAEAYSRGVTEEVKASRELKEMDAVTENAPVKENAVGGEISTPTGKVNQPLAKATMVDNEGNNVEAKVAKIAEVEGGVATLELEGGQTVKASEVDFGDSGIGLVYNAATEMVSGVGGFNVDAANVMVKGFNPTGSVQAAGLYVSGFNEAYRYGAMGYPVSALAKGNATSKLSAAQRETAYNLGKAYGEGKVAEKQAKIDSTVSINDGKDSQKANKKGKVYFDGSAVGKSLTERQKASLKGLRLVAEATGVDIHIFESKVGNNGKRQGANGWYDPVKKEIHLDLHAGIDGNGLMLFTASHELTHHIREVAPAKFKVFADALLEEYTKSGESIDELISRKLETLEANGRLEGMTKEQAYDLAYEEVVADAAESMLVDSDAIEALSKKLQAKDKGLWETIKDFIAKLVNRIKAAYKGIDPDSHEGKLVREMKDSAERLQKLWVEALLEASEVNTVLGENGIVVNSKTDSASLMSVRDVLSDADRKKVSKTLAERFGVTQAEAMDWLKAETSLASLILNPKYSQFLDYTADANEEAIKSNSDYPQGTVDFSNIYKKRRDFTEVMNRILRNFPNHVFAATDLAKIRTIMEQEGMEVACAICYVEDRRQLDGPVAQDFIDSLAIYREGGKIRPDGKPFNANQLKAFKLIEGDTYTPSIYELISLKGRNSLKAKNPAMDEAWVKFNNARGMQSVRLLLNDAEYKRQILKYTPAVVKRKNDYGGLRIYSFSDAEMFHLIDIIQVITDSATVGLSLQGYTKVNEYAKAVKDTGEKLNRSLIPKGDLGYHMENGRVVLDFDTVEGIDINHPDFFDNIDNPNVGNIIIGINATQIKAAMTSKFIDQIIPFHTGQSNEVLGEKGIAAWDNYKDFQSERDAKTKKKSAHQINIYTEVINAAEAEGHPITNKVEFVNKFLEVCRENNLIPRFSDFLNVDENGDYVYTEGYHKFLVDFKTFDQNTGEYLPQMPVKPIFDNEYITKLLTDYVKTQQAKDAELKKAMPKVLDRITKEIVNSDGAKYSDRKFSEGFITSTINSFGIKDTQDYIHVQRQVFDTLLDEGFFTNTETRSRKDVNVESGMVIETNKSSISETFNKDNYKHLGKFKKVAKLATVRMLPEIIKNGKLIADNVPNQYQNSVNKTFAYISYDTEIDGVPITVKLDIKKSPSKNKLWVHSIITEKNSTGQDVSSKNGIGTPYRTDAIGEIIPQDTEIVNRKFSDREKSSYAPTFYSHMGKVIDDIKLEKMGTSSILNHLKNRGVKDEEIKWSGIETFLEGKKSVTKAELQEFVAGSQLQIEEEGSNPRRWEIIKKGQDYIVIDAELGSILDTWEYTEHPEDPDLTGWMNVETGDIVQNVGDIENRADEDFGDGNTRWSQYRLDGGTNYRELVFKMPNSSYSNQAMKAHWGDDAEGVLAHARIQDMTTSDGKKMLFVEEIQSDWHNEGHKYGYQGESSKEEDFAKDYQTMGKMRMILRSEGFMEGNEDSIAEGIAALNVYAKSIKTFNMLIERTRLVGESFDKYVMRYNGDVYVAEENALRFKEALRMVLMSIRSMDVYKNYSHATFAPDAPFRNNYHEYVLKRLIRMAAEEGYASIGWTTADIQSQRWSENYAEGYRIEYDQDIPKFLRKYGKKWGATVGKKRIGEYSEQFEVDLDTMEDSDELLLEEGIKYDGIEVWSMDITKAMKDSVLTEGQPLYSDRNTASFKGKAFWSGSVSLLDGVIEEVHTIEEAEAADFHHSMYFSQAQIEKMENEENAFFFVENGEVQGDWRVSIPESIIERIKDQITTKLSDRNPDSYSNRSLLAGALETAVQNDIEREKLRQYKQKIDLINSEEQKLNELREQIKELSFKKGPRDTEAIRKLQFEANQAANRINTYDRQLLNLESTKALKGVLEREKAQARKRDAQKYKEALERYREKSAKTQRELMDRYQESRKRGVESRNKTAMRHKIKGVVNDLNTYLLKGTKDKHVPIELQKAVAEALDVVNMDTVGAEERIAKLKSEMMRARTPEAVQDIAKKIEHIEEMGGNMAKKISRLKTAYDSIINSDDPLVANSHDDVISSSIERVMEYVGETPLRDMSLPQLEAVYDMYRMVLFSIRNANKAFKAKKSEEISVIANRVMEEVDRLGKKKLQSKAGQTISEFDWNNQKPVYAFERIGSDTFTEVFNNVRAGEDTWATDMTEAQEYREAQYKKHKYDSWDFKKRYAFTSSSGMKFELTIPQIMSLYAYSKREQAAEHLKRGGIVFDETTEVTVKNKLGIPVTFNPTEATAYNISEETLADIISKLSNEQKAFVDEMQDYLSSTMGEKGNEVSLELYGVKLFKEKNYFPLKSATQFMAKAKEQQKGEVKIKNSGFTRETAKKANNPIVLTPFMDVWAGHVNEMSMYHAFTLALEDFYRVYNYKTPTSETMATESVEMFLQNAHGKGATKYIDQLLKDLNGGARVDSTAGIINKLTGLFKKSAVFASLSVVVQQPSAIARATALVDTKYFVGTPSGKKHSETWAEVKKYAPVAVIKEMGYFDTGMGKSSAEWLKGEKTWKDIVDDVASKLPALADEYAWCAIWNAVKRETLHNHTDLKPTSEEFLKLVGERFTEVVTKTQVYDSVLSRSANMRSKDTGMKMATAFMGEPTTSLNMLQDSLIQGKRGNKKYAAKAIGGVISSMILNSILVSIVYAGRDDDEEKTYTEKYISTLTEELLDSFNPLTLVPFVKDIVSIVQGYDIERSDMAVITDLINAWNNLDSDNRSVYRKVEDFGGAIASIFGLPVKNVMRDVRGMYNTVTSFFSGEKTTGAGIGSAIEEAVTGKEKANGQQLYEAMVKGDSAQIERIKGRFEDQKAIDAAIRKALRENDPRIKEAAEAYLEGDYAAYNSLRAEIVSEGIFSNQLVTDALKAEYNYLKKKANEDQ